MKYVMHETAYTPFHCNKVQVQFSFRKKNTATAESHYYVQQFAGHNENLEIYCFGF